MLMPATIRRLSGLLIFLLALSCLLIAPTTRAHGYIVRSIPEDRAALQRPPTRVQYWFSEDLEPLFSEITLLDQSGQQIASGSVDENDRSLMVLRPPSDLPDGAYVVSLRPAFASDGHVIAETRVFFVGEAVSGVNSSAATDRAIPLEIVWRAIVLTSTSLMFGVLVMYSRVFIPAWGSDRFTAGFLPPRVITRLTLILVASFIVALLGNVLALIQNAMVLFNQGIGSVLANNLWNTARLSSRFGDVWNVRVFLFILIGVFLTLTIVWRNEKPRTIAPFWYAMGPAAGLMLGTFAASSHASGSLVMPWVAMLMHWLHMTAVGLWLGGLVTITLVLPVALKPYSGEQRRAALLAVMRRFSPLATAALALTITTGIYNSLNWIYIPSDVTSTRYGIALLYKVLLMIGLLFFGLIHHIAANPERYQKWQNLTQRFGAWRVTLPLESLFAVVIITAAGFVSATPTPTPDFINNEVPAPRAAQTANDLTVDMTISPGGPGVNTYDTRIAIDEQAQNAEAVFVRITQPSTDWRGEWHTAEAIEPGLYVTAGDEISEEGQWLALIDLISENETTRLVFEWNITNEASVIETIPPRWQHWLALSAVMIALTYAVYPQYIAFMRVMNFNNITASVFFVTVLIMGVGSIWGFIYLDNLNQQANAITNPDPQRINPVMPDSVSLQRGADLYLNVCDWENDSRLYQSLIERLPRTRDEELFDFFQNGWRDLPACNANLTENELWDMVNYFRKLEPRGE